MLDQGVWAEVKVADEHLRLFAEHNALGVRASVYNVIAKTWIAPSEPVDDLEGEGASRSSCPAISQACGEFGTAAPTMEGIAVRSLDRVPWAM
jgi:hypothetical protein